PSLSFKRMVPVAPSNAKQLDMNSVDILKEKIIGDVGDLVRKVFMAIREQLAQLVALVSTDLVF
ncbi:hypothetical protein ACJMK2_005782, partial [Sinanodonta woodiana]